MSNTDVAPDPRLDDAPRPSEPRGDRHAHDVIDARLGRPPSDVLEATVVLEAWDGKPAPSAMSAARELVRRDPAPALIGSRIDMPEDQERRSVISEGIALVLSILSVAAWARPLSRELGPRALENAIRVALPVAVALQWVLRSRYLSRRKGLALLAEDGLVCCALVLLLVTAIAVAAPWGRVAALFVLIWVGGTVLTRCGWGLLYALGLVAGTAMLDRAHAVYPTLGALAGFTILLCVVAILTHRDKTDQRAGGLHRAVLAGLIGGGVGVLLVGDPSLGWGVHGVHPAIALVPSVLGSFWGGYYLWHLYEAIPKGLSGVPLERASRSGVSGPAIRVFLGAVLRLLGTTLVLSLLVAALGPWTHGADATTVFLAFGLAALASMMLSLLESLSLPRGALVAVAAALAAEFACRYLAPWHLAGGALAVGAAVGVLLTLPALIALLSRSGRVLATTLWIQ
ncbi:MAG TPA: hypothetical protein VEF89_20375 [Solirubrobacteraceae bacterium]|nr:hypothetical protein [Solirubrobacteraceae bacterium]